MLAEAPKIKVGILGGAFNPVTIGHIKLAKFVISKGVVDQVWLVPCYQHKYNKDMVDPTHRLNMCRLATSSEQTLGVHDIEISLRLTGETFNLIKKIKDNKITEKIYDFSVIIGQDNANTFDKWYKYEELKDMVRFIVVPRKGIEASQDWYKTHPHLFLDMDTDIPEISSTMIRESLSYANRDDVFLQNNVYPEVLDYIFKHKLYDVRF